jgi:hypothetical protein
MRKRCKECACCGSEDKTSTQYYCKSCNNDIYSKGGHLKQWLSRITVRYELTKEEAIDLYDQPECDICEVELTNDRTLTGRCIDHDHDTDKVRGVLCKNCNTGLGMFKDSALVLTKAIKYLQYVE